MIFHTKCGILLVLCTLRYTVKQCVAEDASIFQNEDTDEENAIKDALLLVELLKSVQDKTILRNMDTTVEDSTCAATTLEALGTPGHNETSPAIITAANMVTTTEASMVTTEASMVTTEASMVTTEANMVTTTEASMVWTPNIQFPQYRRAFMPNWPRMPSPHDKQQHHHHHPRDEQQVDYYGPRGFFRRRFPDYFYFQNYYDFPRGNKEKPIPGFRRVQYDEIQTSSASPVTVKTTTTTVSPLTSTTKSMIKATQKRTTESKPIQKKKPVATIENKRAIFKKLKPIFKKNRRQLRVKEPSNTTETTLGSKKIATTMKSPKAIDKQKMTTKGNVTTKDSLKDEIAWELHKELNGSKIVSKGMNKVPTEKFRTTLRIYLDGSTRYHIPFPENHAFCFTNPESWLCRTP